MPAEIPYNTLLAIYFALCAARKGTTRVVITNDWLRQYFVGNHKGQRLSKKQLTDFANRLKPIFPRAKVQSDPNGPKLFLYLNERADETPTKPARVLFLAREAICKELGIKE